MTEEDFKAIVLEAGDDPNTALKKLLATASENQKSKTWTKWAKAKRDFSADEEALARWLTAKLNFINTHKKINTISFEASWQADEENPDDENDPTVAALAIFTGTSFDKNTGAFEAGGDSLEEFEAGYYYVAREMRDISDEPSVIHSNWMAYENEKYYVTGGALASLLIRVLAKLPSDLLLGKERYRFFLLEQPYEVLLGLATKDGFSLARVGQKPNELLSGKSEESPPPDIASKPDSPIAQWADRYIHLTSDEQRYRIIEEVIAESASPREALETMIAIGEIVAPSPRWKKLKALDLSLSPDDISSLRGWLLECLTAYSPYSEINALTFQGCHLLDGSYVVSLMIVKDLDLDSGYGDHDYQRPVKSPGDWNVEAFRPAVRLELKGSSQKASAFNRLLVDAECATFAMELKPILRELDPKLILGAAPYRAVMASFLDKVATGIVTPTGWYELQPGQTLKELYENVS